MCKEIRDKFMELYSKNVNEYVEKKQGLSYLSWAYAWAEFKKIYPDAIYEVKKDADGKCYFGDENIGYMVYTTVTAGGLTYEMWLPVMDNNNKAMKLLAYEYQTRNGKKTVEAISMFDINKAVMRCLVKNISMFGLGLYIYAGDDLPEAEEEEQIAEPEITFADALSYIYKEGKYPDKPLSYVYKNDIAYINELGKSPDTPQEIVKMLCIINEGIKKANEQKQ